MSELVHVILFGSLRKTRMDSSNPAEKFQVVAQGTPLKDVINRLDIRYDKVQLAMLNHRAVSKDSRVNPGDRLALFPAEYPIYPDWDNFRF